MACRLDDMYDVVEKLKIEKTQVVCENASLEEELAALASELEQFRNIQKQLCCELDHNYETTEELTEEKCQLETILTCKDQEILRLENIQREVEKLKHRIQCMEEEVACSDARRCSLEEEGGRLQSCLQDKESAIQCLEEQVQALCREKCDLEQSSKLLRSDRMSLKKDIEDVKNCLGKTLMKIYDMNQCMKQEERTRQTLNDQICHLKLYIEQTEQSMNKEKEKREQLTEELRCVQDNIEKQCNENVFLQSTIECTIQKLDQRDECLQKTRCMLERVKQEYDAYRTSVEELKGQIVGQRATGICMRVSHSAKLFSDLHCPSIDFKLDPALMYPMNHTGLSYQTEPMDCACQEDTTNIPYQEGSIEHEDDAIDVTVTSPVEQTDSSSTGQKVQSDTPPESVQSTTEGSSQRYPQDRRRRKCRTVPCDDRKGTRSVTKQCPSPECPAPPPPEPKPIPARRCDVSHPRRQRKRLLEQQSKGEGRGFISEQQIFEKRNRKILCDEENDTLPDRKYVSEQRIRDVSTRGENRRRRSCARKEQQCETGQGTSNEEANDPKKTDTPREDIKRNRSITHLARRSGTSRNCQETEKQPNQCANETENSNRRNPERSRMRRCCMSSKRKRQ